MAVQVIVVDVKVPEWDHLPLLPVDLGAEPVESVKLETDLLQEGCTYDPIVVFRGVHNELVEEARAGKHDGADKNPRTE